MAPIPPLKQTLLLGRNRWDTDHQRPAVPAAFQKVLACKTLALGAEVYSSSATGFTRIVSHTCKSRACPSCGQRANLQWLRERWCALPDIPYAHLVLTMPDVLWPIFQRNRHLLHDLPTLGAAVVQQWARRKYGVRPLLTVMPHIFGRDLKFHPHLHLLVSQGGLNETGNAWVPSIRFDMQAIMRMWRYAVITFLRTAYRQGVLVTDLARREFFQLLEEQYDRWWHVFCGELRDRLQVLRYAGRYVRRPPIGQHRIRAVTAEEVHFVTKDLKLKRTVELRMPLTEFVDRLAQHVPNHYTHNVRHFGLLAPRTRPRLLGVVFHLLGQEPRPRPRPLRWALALHKYFGGDPLQDPAGHPLHWAGRLPAAARVQP